MRMRAIAELGGPPLAALAVWFGVGWVPTALAGDAERLTQAEGQRDVLLAEVAAARSLPAAAGPAEQRLSAAATAVPPWSDVAEFVRLVGELALANGVVVDQVSPLTVSSDTDPEATARLPAGTSSVTLSIGTRGPYEALMTLFDALRHHSRLVIFDLIDLTADENDAGLLVADLEVRIFTTEALIRPAVGDEPVADEPAAADPATGADTAADGTVDPEAPRDQ